MEKPNSLLPYSSPLAQTNVKLQSHVAHFRHPLNLRPASQPITVWEFVIGSRLNKYRRHIALQRGRHLEKLRETQAF